MCPCPGGPLCGTEGRDAHLPSGLLLILVLALLRHGRRGEGEEDEQASVSTTISFVLSGCLCHIKPHLLHVAGVGAADVHYRAYT